MRKTASILFALVMAASLVLMPAAVLAQDGEGYGGLHNCEFEPLPKWYDNEPSYYLYLMHWGRTPVSAMSRLAGLCSPDTLCAQLGSNCPGPDACWHCECATCRDEEPGCLACCDDPVACEASKCDVACPTIACQDDACSFDACCTCNPERVIEQHLPHCCCCWGVSLAFANKSWAGCTISTHPRVNDQHLNHFGTSDCYGGNKGGDWGVSGCPHTECCSLTWCLQDNLCANPLANK